MKEAYLYPTISSSDRILNPHNKSRVTVSKEPIHILLADDDEDDRFFFAKTLNTLAIPTRLTTVDDGAQLMSYLHENSGKLPDILFLDINMPRKNGSECLSEIKSSKSIGEFPIVMYSTSLSSTVVDLLYENGAYYYLRKGILSELEENLQAILTSIREDKLVRPPRDRFILKLLQA